MRVFPISPCKTGKIVLYFVKNNHAGDSAADAPASLDWTDTMKILILSCSTGEGHNSAAKAMAEAFREAGNECEILDPVSFKSKKMQHIVSASYNNLIRVAPFAFGWIYKIGEVYDRSDLPSPIYWANGRYAEALYRYITENRFDRVVCTHLFGMEAMTAIARKYPDAPPCYAVLTDYVATPFYSDTELSGYFAPNEEVRQELIAAGIREDRIYPTGIPVSGKMSRDIPKEEARRLLSVDPDKKVIAVMSGGAGCGNLVKLCGTLDRDADDSRRILVFPGRNEALAHKLHEAFRTNPRVRIIPFTPDIYLYFKASDVVLTKPGGLSSTEIAAANVPLVHLKEIPGCETENVRYFTSHGMSVRAESAEKAADAVDRLLTDAAAAEEMRRCQREYIHPDSARRIAESVLEETR